MYGRTLIAMTRAILAPSVEVIDAALQHLFGAAVLSVRAEAHPTGVDPWNRRAVQLPESAIVSWDFENRLELARRMRYPCGGHTDRPGPGWWFTKPVRNPSGMGVGARPNIYRGGANPGWARTFGDDCMWMPVFTGEHFSVDFRRCRGGAWRQMLTVRCDYDVLTARPARWCKKAVEFPVPEALRGVDAEWLNVEFIDGNVIEAHGRRNTDFDNARSGAMVAQVIWADQQRPAAFAPDFDDADGQLAIARLGFVYR